MEGEPPTSFMHISRFTPFDLVKYEIDKTTGYLRVDRPQRSSSQPPTLYGFIPRTYCGARVGKLASAVDLGDGDPLDICVVSERPINRSEVIVTARVVGGLSIVDGNEADDKIVAVLQNDTVWAKANDISELPGAMVERLRHYFSTYKMRPDGNAIVDHGIYGREHALAVVEASMADYSDEFGE